MGFHPPVPALVLSAIHVRTTGGMDETLQSIALLLYSMTPLNACCARPSSGAPIEPHLYQASADANRLLDADETAIHDFHALKSHLARQSSPRTDIRACLRLYDAGYCPAEMADVKVRLADAETLLQTYINKQRSRVASMAPSDARKLVKEITTWASGEGLATVCSVNNDGMPTVFWPATSTTRDLLTMAFRLWVRGVTQCDRATITAQGYMDCEKGSTAWLSTTKCWLRYLTRHRAIDALTGIKSGLIGGTHLALRPTLPAHRSHGRDFGGTENATVQCWGANLFLRQDQQGSTSTRG